MKTVQMTLDEDLVREVDGVAREIGSSRSAFTRDALRAAVAKHRIAQLEKKHRQGYEKRPVRRGEFDIWENEQAWGDE